MEAELTEASDVKPTDEEAGKTDVVLAIKGRIILLKRKRSKLISWQNTVKINYDDTSLASEDLEELVEFILKLILKHI